MFALESLLLGPVVRLVHIASAAQSSLERNLLLKVGRHRRLLVSVVDGCSVASQRQVLANVGLLDLAEQLLKLKFLLHFFHLTFFVRSGHETFSLERSHHDLDSIVGIVLLVCMLRRGTN